MDAHLLHLQEYWMAAHFDQKAMREYVRDTENLVINEKEEKEVDLRKEFSKLAAIMAIGKKIK